MLCLFIYSLCIFYFVHNVRSFVRGIVVKYIIFFNSKLEPKSHRMSSIVIGLDGGTMVTSVGPFGVALAR